MVEKRKEKQAADDAPTPNYSVSAYTIARIDNTWAVVELKFDPTLKLASPDLNIIESNTDVYIVRERLQVLLMKDEIL